jgi:uncharacterized membrane protein YeaQ/YmgE (transglycosylase-associated protein family)
MKMEDAQGFLGHSEVGFLSMLLVGAIAGWIAEKVTASNHSIFTNILVGIAGAFVAEVLSPEYSGFWLPQHLGGRDHRLHLDPFRLASGSQPSLTRRAEMAVSRRSSKVSPAGAQKREN